MVNIWVYHPLRIVVIGTHGYPSSTDGNKVRNNILGGVAILKPGGDPEVTLLSCNNGSSHGCTEQGPNVGKCT